MIFDKLFGICGDFVCMDLEWEKWDFVKFSEVVCLWIRRNFIDMKLYERDLGEW